MLKAGPKHLYHIPRIREGMDLLLSSDPVFKAWGLTPEDFPRPYYGAGFPALCRIVIGQQVSTHAADALWKRFEEGLPNVTPNAVLILKQDDLRQLGLSQQKANYIFNLAEKINAGEFDPKALEHMDDEAVYNAITDLKGFGKWSAEIFLMFCLPEIWVSKKVCVNTIRWSSARTSNKLWRRESILPRTVRRLQFCYGI